MTLIYDHASPSGSTALNGSADNDTIVGFAGNDTINGGAGDDYIFEGIETWYVPTGSGLTYGQTYNFGAGNDVIDGGAGFDFLDYANRHTAMRVDLSAQTVASGSERDTFRGIEALELGQGADRVTGVQIGIGLFLEGGADTLSGAAGFAYADGGYGLDLLDFSTSTKSVTINLLTGHYSLGGTSISGEIINFEIVKGARMASNLMVGGKIENNLTGGNLGDTIKGSVCNDVLVGLAGNDSIDGGSGADILFGGVDTDRIFGGSGKDSIYGGDGNDVILDDAGGAIVFSGYADDRVTFGALKADSPSQKYAASGGAGNDTIVLNLGTYIISNKEIKVNGVLSTISGFEHIVLGATAQNITDVKGMDNFHLGAGNDTLSTFVSGRHYFLDSGDDRGKIICDHVSMSGGLGDDRIEVNGNYNTLMLESGNDSVAIFGDSKETIVNTGTGDDSVGNTALTGWSRIITESGNDSVMLDAASFVDTGIGNDSIWVSASADLIDSNIYTQSGDDSVMTSGHIGILDLGSGDDYALLRGATAMAYGGYGNDYFSIQSKGCSVFSGDGNDVVDTYTVSYIDAGNGDDIINIDGKGSIVKCGAGNDVVDATRAITQLDMGSGNDHLIATHQFETVGYITGGAGADLFEFATGGEVFITDFSIAEDRLAIVAAGYITNISDFDSVSVETGGVVLIDGGFTIHLNKLTLADLANIHFVHSSVG